MISTLYEPFRHWSEGGSICILSDLHFDDWDCSLMNPDWITPKEQIKIINKHVKKNDTFICLGDVGEPECMKEIRANKKILILGNHDSRGRCEKYFDEIYAGPVFIAEKILLSHEPVYGLPWCLNIHGHDYHNMEPYKEGCKHLNLAANVCGYIPVNLGSVCKYLTVFDLGFVTLSWFKFCLSFQIHISGCEQSFSDVCIHGADRHIKLRMIDQNLIR